MKKGSEYEQFAYDKFRKFFVEAKVTKNDKIKGNLSGLTREIDVSIRMTVASTDLLYIVQCKDWATKPADIKVLGEFSSVILDIGASKGFLLCTSGFAKTNHTYALTLGIELLTIEDINSEKWKADIEIPFVYIRKNINYALTLDFIVNEELVAKHRDKEVQIQLDTSALLTSDDGKTQMTIVNFIDSKFEDPNFKGREGVELNLLDTNLKLKVTDVWVPCGHFSIVLTIVKKYYLKYLTPDEYSHIRDHVRKTTLPLHAVFKNIGLKFDDSFIELPDDKPPVILGLHFVTEDFTTIELEQNK